MSENNLNRDPACKSLKAASAPAETGQPTDLDPLAQEEAFHAQIQREWAEQAAAHSADIHASQDHPNIVHRPGESGGQPENVDVFVEGDEMQQLDPLAQEEAYYARIQRAWAEQAAQKARGTSRQSKPAMRPLQNQQPPTQDSRED